MKKKALSLLLACAMTFSLAACGGKGGETEAPAADNAETEAPAEAGNDAEARDDAEAPAASDGAVIKIGGQRFRIL